MSEEAVTPTPEQPSKFVPLKLPSEITGIPSPFLVPIQAIKEATKHADATKSAVQLLAQEAAVALADKYKKILAKALERYNSLVKEYRDIKPKPAGNSGPPSFTPIPGEKLSPEQQARVEVLYKDIEKGDKAIALADKTGDYAQLESWASKMA